MYMAPFKCFSDCAVKSGKRTEKHSALVRFSQIRIKAELIHACLGNIVGI